MKAIAWDTSTPVGMAMTLEWDPQNPALGMTLCSNFSWNNHIHIYHSERLLWAIHQVLVAAKWSVHEIEIFAVGLGPGSFTGLRIGITTARTFAHFLNKPLIGVSSLSLIARPIAWAAPPGAWISVINQATAQEVFALFGQKEMILNSLCPGQAWEPLVEEALLSSFHIVEKMQSKKKWFCGGNGFEKYSQVLQESGIELIFPFPFKDRVYPEAFAQMIAQSIEKKSFLKELEVFPRYLKSLDAFKKKE